MHRNILANILGKFWSLISLYVFIPLYIHFLGIEVYGLISFFAIMQTVLGLLDGGLSSTLRREFSSGNYDYNNRLRKYKLLRSIEFCYTIIVSIIIIVIISGAQSIVKKWLHVGDINSSLATSAIRLMGLSIAIQFFSSLYYNGLLGLESQVKANYYQIGSSVLKNVGVVFVLWLVKADIRLFYLWFICVDVVYLLALRVNLFRTLHVNGSFIWSIKRLDNLRSIGRYAIGVLMISIISAINFQLDSIVVSKYLPITDLGIYNLAFSLSQLPVILVNAIVLALFPRFVFYYSTKDFDSLKSLFTRSYKTLGILAISLSIFICMFSKDLLIFWTKNHEIASEGSMPASLLIIGSAFLALQIIPFNIALAHSVTKINIYFGVINIIIVIPMLLYLVPMYGIIGAAFTWFFILLFLTPFYNCYVYYKFIGTNWLKWFIRDTALPILIISVIAVGFYLIKIFLIRTLFLSILYAIFSGLLTLSLGMFLLNKKELNNIFSYCYKFFLFKKDKIVNDAV